jgi:aminoglycoside 6'-N-acetyltransferase I
MTVSTSFRVRLAIPSDVPTLAQLFWSLWPEAPAAHHAGELQQKLAGTFQTVMPLLIFVAEENGAILGFLEAGLRSTADDCDVSRPVGYVEGWYVIESRRGQGIGRALLSAAEGWARQQGCHEMASDADINNTLSHRVHQASGFTIASRSILFRKSL